MGFFKTSLAVATGILGAMGLIAFGQHLSESGAIDKLKDRAAKFATEKGKKAEEAAAATK